MRGGGVLHGMRTLVLVRHGQSEWNAQGRFTGWVDVGLTDAGREEARRAGAMLAETGLDLRFACTSVLTRAIQTLHIIQQAMRRSWMEERKDWRLNEKHYGMLQGRSKRETADEFGSDQVHRWRRAYDCAPPPLEGSAALCTGQDPRYAGLDAGCLPRTESLRDTRARVEACWRNRLAPALRHHGDLLVVAHGNSLRALMMMLQNLTPGQVERLEIPTGRPLLVQLDDALQCRSTSYAGGVAVQSW